MKLSRLSGSLLVVIGLGLLLQAAGGGALDVPFRSLDDLNRWTQDTTPDVMAIALLRLAGMAACAYLAAVLGVALTAELAGWHRIAGMALRALPATLRRAAAGSAQFGLAAGAILVPLAPDAATPQGQPSVAVMVKLDPGPTRPPQPPVAAAMVHLGPGEPREVPAAPEPATRPPAVAPPTDQRSTGQTPATPEPATRPSAEEPPTDQRSTGLTPADAGNAPAEPGADSSPATRPSIAATWVVGSGDSFWSIAESVLGETDESQVAVYWQHLIEANTDRLVAPGHPDVLRIGQTLVVPVP